MRNLTAFVLLLAGCAQFDRFEAGLDDQQVVGPDVLRPADAIADVLVEADAETGVDAPVRDDAPADVAQETAADVVVPVDTLADAAVDAVPTDVLTPLQSCQARCYRAGYQCLATGSVYACCFRIAGGCGGHSLCQQTGETCGGPDGTLGTEQCCRVY